MSIAPPLDRAAVARERLAARARRVARIRRRVAATALAAFVLAWGLVVFDGPMGSATASTTTASSSSNQATAPWTGDGPAAVTTTQS